LQLEDPIKYTERQRLLKEKTMERRRAYNQSYFARMRQEDADRRRAEMEKRRQDRLDKETKIRQEKNDAYRQYQQSLASKNEAMTAYYQAKVEALEQGLPLEEALKRANIALKEAQARLANTKANAGGFAPQRPVQAKETTTTTTKVDSLGDKTTTTTTKRTGPAGSTSSQNTPPSRRNTSTTSRRKTSQSSNTPPSRRRKS
jgi:multidrug resistance efflux pump